MVTSGMAGRTPRVRGALAVAVAGLMALLQHVSADTGAAPAGRHRPLAVAATPKAFAAYGALPLAFVANAGQADASIRYEAETAGARFSFTRARAIFAFTRGQQSAALELSFADANRSPLIEGVGEQAGRRNYLIGKDPARWQIGLRAYREIVYRDLWPGIDLAFRDDSGSLKYEFRLAPGADASRIRLRYRGADRLTLAPAGQLHIHTALGVLRDSRPVSYQTIGGRRVPVETSYRLTQGRTGYGFSVGTYDAGRTLVIDPGIVYSTFLGGPSTDAGRAVAVDSGGNAYVTGLFGGNNAFVTRLDSSGAVVYSTILGGSQPDDGLGIAVDAAGYAIVTGWTMSSNFPTTQGAFDTTYNGGAFGNGGDAFVARLDPAGAIVYSTYLGGEFSDEGRAIAVDEDGNAYVTGVTRSFQFPVTAGAYDTAYGGVFPGSPGNFDFFVTKLNPEGSALVYSTFIGTANGDEAYAVAVDGAGNAYVAGTVAVGFPTTEGAYDRTHNGNSDLSVTKLNPWGSALVYSTFVGGSSSDTARAIAVDADGNAYVTGQTGSTNFPTVAAIDTSLGGFLDGFVIKVNSIGSALVYSTYLGGANATAGFDEQGTAIAVDGTGNAHVSGLTSSPDFPTTPGAFDTTFNSVHEPFVTKLDPTGSLAYSTFLPGSLERADGIALDAAGSAYVTGSWNNNGTADIFIVKLAIAAAPAELTVSPASGVKTAGEEHCITATVADQFGNPVSGISVRLSVSGANTAAGAATSDASGQAVLCYTGTIAGVDAITVFADTDGDGSADADEPIASAANTYVVGAAATLALSPWTAFTTAGSACCVTAIVEDRFRNAVPGITVIFVVAGANTGAGAGTTDAIGRASFCYTGTIAGVDLIKAFADTDGDASQDADELSANALNTYVAAAPATLTLTPATDTNPVGTTHSVTATLFDAYGNRLGEDIVVRFSVSGSVAASGSCTTDAAGACDFAYSGPDFPGADLITAFADTDENGERDPSEPAGEASKSWIVPTSTPGQASGGGNFQVGDDRVAFGFSARNGDKGARGSCNVVDRANDVMVECTDVIAFIISDNVVTVYGNALVNGVATSYRIDAADNARRGRGADVFSIQTASGYARVGTLVGGNVRVE